jgi:hypothetical protein
MDRGLNIQDSNPRRGNRIFFFSGNLHTDSGYHPVSYLTDVGVLSREQSDRAVKMTTHLHVGPMLRISGVIPLLPLFAFSCTYMFTKATDFYKDYLCF